MAAALFSTASSSDVSDSVPPIDLHNAADRDDSGESDERRRQTERERERERAAGVGLSPALCVAARYLGQALFNDMRLSALSSNRKWEHLVDRALRRAEADIQARQQRRTKTDDAQSSPSLSRSVSAEARTDAGAECDGGDGGEREEGKGEEEEEKEEEEREEGPLACVAVVGHRLELVQLKAKGFRRVLSFAKTDMAYCSRAARHPQVSATKREREREMKKGQKSLLAFFPFPS
jgi:hypothetical protein